MTRYAAFIRGIGPGDPRKSNPSLVSALEELGYADVAAVISSGNVVFTGPDAAAEEEIADHIEAAWPELRGFAATTIVRSAPRLAALVDALPFSGPHGREAYQTVTFLKRPVTTLAEAPAGVRSYGLVDGALCLQAGMNQIAGPDLMVWLERSYGRQITTRTSLTLQRILKRM